MQIIGQMFEMDWKQIKKRAYSGARKWCTAHDDEWMVKRPTAPTTDRLSDGVTSVEQATLADLMRAACGEKNAKLTMEVSASPPPRGSTDDETVFLEDAHCLGLLMVITPTRNMKATRMRSITLGPRSLSEYESSLARWYMLPRILGPRPFRLVLETQRMRVFRLAADALLTRDARWFKVL
ncbi:hypothetical protein MPH_06121 [Macrophomina phaseolina MS6]|uniref:Uncharacterized protein n=1 Tax=Macrophomina phaseolina (strain MS6) TaxID=1126212 RepID=K2RVD8_MACPH|nr:hypothetical protein MPH_06121 [Macrophomina phaseolina MS6]